MIGGSLGRRADDGEHALAVDAELGEHRRVGLEVGEVVVLLQARVAEQLALGRPRAAHRLDPDRVGDQHPARGAEGELALQARELVVLHLRRRDPQQRRDDGEVDRAVADREVEAPRPRAQRGQRAAAAGQREALGRGRAAAVAADHLVLEPEPLEDADGLAVLAGR